MFHVKHRIKFGAIVLKTNEGFAETSEALTTSHTHSEVETSEQDSHLSQSHT